MVDNLLGNDEEYHRELIQLDQQAVSHQTNQLIQYQQNYYKLYQEFYNQFHVLTIIEDELTEIRNNKQQELEGRTYAINEKMKVEQNNLLLSQIQRRYEIENVKLQNERDLIGLDEQMKQKRNQLVSSLQSIFNVKRNSREKELIESNETSDNMKLISGSNSNLNKNLNKLKLFQLNGTQRKKYLQSEFELYEAEKLKEIEVFLFLEEKKLRNEFSKVMEMETSEVMTQYNHYKECLEL